MLISIIVPVYNVAQYLQRCVNSIEKQTLKELEIILVDDGSTDISGTLCDQLAEKYCNIKVIHKKNGGLSSARNAGIDMARGEYLGFVDSDDYIDNSMYETLLNAIIAYKADVACCGRTLDLWGEYEKKEFILDKPHFYSKKDAIREILLLENIDVSACDKLYNRKLFDTIRYPEGKINEDAAVIFDIIDKANGIIHVGNAFYHYIFRKNSITTSAYSEKKLNVYDNMNHIDKFINAHYPDLKSELRIFCCINSAALLLDMYNDDEAMKKYPHHYRLYKKTFNRGFKTALLSKRINRKMKLRLVAIKTHTVNIYMAIKKIYAHFRKASKK